MQPLSTSAMTSTCPQVGDDVFYHPNFEHLPDADYRFKRKHGPWAAKITCVRDEGADLCVDLCVFPPGDTPESRQCVSFSSLPKSGTWTFRAPNTA